MTDQVMEKVDAETKAAITFLVEAGKRIVEARRAKEAEAYQAQQAAEERVREPYYQVMAELVGQPVADFAILTAGSVRAVEPGSSWDAWFALRIQGFDQVDFLVNYKRDEQGVLSGELVHWCDFRDDKYQSPGYWKPMGGEPCETLAEALYLASL